DLLVSGVGLGVGGGVGGDDLAANVGAADLDVPDADGRVVPGGLEDLDEFPVLQGDDVAVAGGQPEDRPPDEEDQDEPEAIDEPRTLPILASLVHRNDLPVVGGEGDEQAPLPCGPRTIPTNGGRGRIAGFRPSRAGGLSRGDECCYCKPAAPGGQRAVRHGGVKAYCRGRFIPSC